MTEKQRLHFYLPTWARAYKANWRSADGGVEVIPGLPENEYRTKVAEVASQLAAEDNRVPKTDDLRKACTYIATGKWSSKKLNNKAVNRLVCFLRLLINPDDLSSLVVWQNPTDFSRSERPGLEARIRKYPEAYVQHLVRTQSHGLCTDWRQLDNAKLQHLVWTLSRRSVPGAPAARPAPERAASSSSAPEKSARVYVFLK